MPWTEPAVETEAAGAVVEAVTDAVTATCVCAAVCVDTCAEVCDDVCVDEDCGVCVEVPHFELFAFSAWTSTSWPPAQGAAVCGWLFPGPCSTVLGAAPFLCAISPAVRPFPYCFV